MRTWIDDDLFAAANRAAEAGGADDRTIGERIGMSLGSAEPRLWAASIEADEAGYFVFPPWWRGLSAVVQVRDRLGETIDLAAWDFDNPRRWWLYSKGATLLGERYLAQCECSGFAAYMVETPLDWWKGGGQSVCVLDWAEFDPLDAFAGVPKVSCSSRELGERLMDCTRARARPSWAVTIVRAGAHAA